MLKRHVLFLGCTGAGKSSTINKILGKDLAKIGVGVDPQTQKILGYSAFPLVLWDTPGLGESPNADALHIKEINSLITGIAYSFDKIIIVCESGKRDLESVYKLINEVVKKNKFEGKMVLALNQCDLAMKKNSWNDEYNIPNNELHHFLLEQLKIFEYRIKESTGINIKESIFYSAKFNYNLDKVKEIIM